MTRRPRRPRGMRRTRPRFLAALLATVLVAGCGGPDATELLDGALETLEDAGTARFAMEVTSAGDGGATFRADGAQDLTDGSLRMTIDLGDDARGIETLELGGDVFVRSPLFEVLTGDADQWVRIDLAAAGTDLGLDAEALLAGNTGPAALLAQLEGATEEVEELDGEEVRGVATRRLRVMVSTTAALDRAPSAVREQLRAYAEATGLPDRYPMELWVGDDGLVRRIRTVLDQTTGEVGETQAGTTQQTTLELFDFGVSVDLRAPLSGDTTDLDELIRRLEEAEADLAG